MPADGAFGPRLRRLRHDARLTIAELAQASGVSARAISDMERGVSRPQRRTAAALAEALRVTDISEPGAAPAFTGRTFLGRSREIDLLRRLAASAQRERGAPVAVVYGLAGQGKTALARYVSRELRFPGGTHHATLSDGSPVPALLGSLGVPPHRIPDAPDEQAALYRSLLRRRAALVVLDDAPDEPAVRPLLPAAGPSLTIVTSRRLLSGLDAVHRLHLDGLPPREAVRLLSELTGGDPPAAGPTRTGLTRTARICDGVPLALEVAAGAGLDCRRLVTDGPLADALHDTYRRLSPPAAHLFSRLPAGESGLIGEDTAATAAGVDLATAQDALDELVETALIRAVTADRYRIPALSRLFLRGFPTR